MTVTNYIERKHGDHDVEVQFVYGGQTVTGFIDARWQNDGVWEAWLWFSYEDHGWRATRKNWVPMEGLTLLSIDDVPISDQRPLDAHNEPH